MSLVFPISRMGASPTLPAMQAQPRIITFGAMAIAAIFIAGCSSSNNLKKAEEGYSPRVVAAGKPVPKGGGTFKVGKPYTIKGRTYRPAEDPSYDKVGVASWYGDDFHGRLTANGEVYDMHAFTAAHPTLPLPTYARVTNMANGKSLVVRINDRGPFAKDRIIDLSKKTAQVLDFKNDGVARVRVQYVGRAPLDGEDDWLSTTVRNDGVNNRVLQADRAVATRAFASDGERGARKDRVRMASSAYRNGGGTLDSGGSGRTGLFGFGNRPPTPRVALPTEAAPVVAQVVTPAASLQAPPPLAPAPAALPAPPPLAPAPVVAQPIMTSDALLAPQQQPALALANPSMTRVQAGIFESETNAQQVAAALTRNADVTVDRMWDGSRWLHVVRAEPFDTGASLVATQAQLTSMGLTPVPY